MTIWYSDENALAREKMLAKSVEHLGPSFTEIIKQGIREGVFTTPYPEVTSQVLINVISDVAYTSGKVLISGRVKEAEALKQVEMLYAAYADALERTLGAPKGSINFMMTDVLKTWFSGDTMLTGPEAEIVEETNVSEQ